MFGGLLIEEGIESDCSLFDECKVLPGDEVWGGIVVLGMRDGVVYGRSGDGVIVEVDKMGEVVVRHVYSVCENAFGFV
jgi:hypothetical protein